MTTTNVPPTPIPNTTSGSAATYLLLILVGLPILCGAIVTISTWVRAQHDVDIWRGEFQRAVDVMCPTEDVDIVGGEGKVYLNAYALEYTWEVGSDDDYLFCQSDGRVVRCSCSDTIDFIGTTGSGQ